MNHLNKKVSKRVDKEKYVTISFYLRFPIKGGETNYYSGLTSKDHGKLQQQIQYEHVRITIGRFDKIAHSAEPWTGNRGCVNFIPKKKELKQFLKHETKYQHSIWSIFLHIWIIVS